MKKLFLFSLMISVFMISTSAFASPLGSKDLTSTKLLEPKIEILDLNFDNGVKVDFTEVNTEKEVLTSEISDADEALHCKVKITEGEKTIKFTCWFCDCAAFAEALTVK